MMIGTPAAVAPFAPVDKPSAASRRRFTKAGDVASLAGVWRSRGYGWLVEIESGRAQFHDESAGSCVPRGDGGLDVDSIADSVMVSTDGRTLRMPIEDPAYLYTFDRIAALPQACGSDADIAPQSVLDAVLELFSTHYAFFEERNVDWQALADTARRHLSRHATEDRLLEVIGDLICGVDDAHVSLTAEHLGRSVLLETGDGPTLRRVAAQAAHEKVSPDDMLERWEDLFWDRDTPKILQGGKVHWSLNDRMVHGVIGDDIGYIALATMEGYTHRRGGAAADIRALDLTMERVLDRFGEVEAVIVDISMNDGGHDMVARALAGRFAMQRTIGYYKYAGDADGDEPQAIRVEPSEGRRFTGPVYLLTSDYTMSAAEIFTMAMRALANVTHLGQATRGTLSDELSKPLPIGWTLNLSNEVYLDADGKCWEGSGIAPQIALEVFCEDDVTKGHVEAVRAIVDAIRSGEPVSATHD